MRARTRAFLIGATGSLAALLGGCGTPPALEGCDPAGGIEPICGFENPEDLALLPGGQWLAVSQMSRGDGPGSLVAWRSSDGAKAALWPGGAVAPAPDWGDPACPGPPDPQRFAPHGIDDLRRPMGEPGLLVVNHGGREAVEFFEVGVAAGRPALFWRGCAVLPPEAWPNDVAALPGGRGFVVSKMASQGLGGGPAPGPMLRILLGLPTGFVYAWTPEEGWRQVPGSAGVLPNGVEVSADGSRLFYALSYDRKIVSQGLDGSQRREVAVDQGPDNLTWTADGRLLAAGGAGSSTAAMACQKVRPAACGVPFAVTAIDPDAMTAVDLVRHDGHSAFGMASVALPVGDRLYVGSFQGDRIARVALPAR